MLLVFLFCFFSELKPNIKDSNFHSLCYHFNPSAHQSAPFKYVDTEHRPLLDSFIRIKFLVETKQKEEREQKTTRIESEIQSQREKVNWTLSFTIYKAFSIHLVDNWNEVQSIMDITEEMRANTVTHRTHQIAMKLVLLLLTIVMDHLRRFKVDSTSSSS